MLGVWCPSRGLWGSCPAARGGLAPRAQSVVLGHSSSGSGPAGAKATRPPADCWLLVVILPRTMCCVIGKVHTVCPLRLALSPSQSSFSDGQRTLPCGRFPGPVSLGGVRGGTGVSNCSALRPCDRDLQGVLR